MERTLIIIKPDAINRHLAGEILSVYEKNGLLIDEIRTIKPSLELLELHYAEHVGRDFYPDLVKFMSSSKVVIAALKGEGAVEKVRFINGSTNPKKASPNTIRYIYGTDVQKNAVHGSASLKEAEREIEIWFGHGEKHD